jgi:hypothetical protein
MNTSKPLIGFAAALSVLCAMSDAPAATVYKWVDEKGVVNYTTTPPSNRMAAAVDVAPAVAGQGGTGGDGEACYWRERAQREAASGLEQDRLRRETEQLRQSKLRQEMAAAEAASKQKTAAQLAYEQCRSERRVDCETLLGLGGAPGYALGYASGGIGSSLYAYPPVVVTRRRAVPAPTGPYFSVTSNFTPGFSTPLIYATPAR